MRTKDRLKEFSLHENAVRIISRSGFEGLSMQKLARASRISAATIYVYFKNREDLLNKVYIRLEEEYHDAIMTGFNPLMPLEEGLWLQWRNIYRFIADKPTHYRFLEQFRHSPLIAHNEVAFIKNKMAIFFQNAIRVRELVPMPTEMLMAAAFGPLYNIIRISGEEKVINSSEFILSERKLKALFDVTLKGLRPV